MNDLRLSLIVISVLAVIVVYLLSWINQRQNKRSRDLRVEPSLNDGAGLGDGDASEDVSFEVKIRDDHDDKLLFPDPDPSSSRIPAFVMKHDDAPNIRGDEITEKSVVEPAPDNVASSETVTTPRIAEQVIVLNVVARPGFPFRGESIQRTLEKLGLELGDMGFFNLNDVNDSGKREPVFSVASMVKPGTFDRDALSTYSTPGLSLFMQVPGPIAASEAFDAMNECAGSIAVRLGGTVCDENREPMPPLRAREIREQLLARDFSAAVHESSGFSAGERP